MIEKQDPFLLPFPTDLPISLCFLNLVVCVVMVYTCFPWVYKFLLHSKRLPKCSAWGRIGKYLWWEGRRKEGSGINDNTHQCTEALLWYGSSSSPLSAGHSKFSLPFTVASIGISGLSGGSTQVLIPKRTELLEIIPLSNWVLHLFLVFKGGKGMPGGSQRHHLSSTAFLSLIV